MTKYLQAAFAAGFLALGALASPSAVSDHMLYDWDDDTSDDPISIYNWGDWESWESWGVPELGTFEFTRDAGYAWSLWSSGYTDIDNMPDSPTGKFHYEGAYEGHAERLNKDGEWDEREWDVKGRARVTYTPKSYTGSDTPSVDVRVFNVRRYSSNGRWTGLPGKRFNGIEVERLNADRAHFHQVSYGNFGEYTFVDGAFFGDEGEWVAATVFYEGTRRNGSRFAVYGGLAAEQQED